jgi:hypothetical protein
MALRVVGVLTILVLVLPVVHAETSGRATYRFDTPSKLAFALDTTRNGTDASSTRKQIDDGGNQNGRVEQFEVDYAERTFLNLTKRLGATGSSDFTVDGHASTNLTVEQVHFRDAVGPITSVAPLEFTMSGTLLFPAMNATSHTLRVRSNQSSSNQDIKSSALVMPSGYIVKSAKGLPAGAKVSKDKRQIDFAGPIASQNEMTVVYAVGSVGAVSARTGWLLAGAVLVVAVIGLGFVLARRKRPPI